MNRLKLVGTAIIMICGVCLIVGCQNDSELFWYKPGNNVYECKSDWTNHFLGGDCYFNKDCMYKRGYRLFKREQLPPGTQVENIDIKYEYLFGGPTTPQHGVGGDNITTEEKNLNARKQYIENHPDLSDQKKQAILDGNIIKRMTREEIIIAWNKCDYEWKFIMRDSRGYEVWDLGLPYYNPYLKKFIMDAPYRCTFLNNKLIDWVKFGHY